MPFFESIFSTFGGVSLALLSTFQSATAQSTPSPTFEVVSIKPAPSERIVQIKGFTANVPATWKPCEYSAMRVRCRMPLAGYLREAFRLREFELTAPSWTKDDMFDLQAVMPANTPVPVAREMLKHAIVETFNIRYHMESRATDVFAMVPTADGPHLTEFDLDKPQTRTLDVPSGKISYNSFAVPGHYFSSGGTLDVFAQNLCSFAGLNRPVINKTGLEGRYTIDLTWKSGADPDDPLRPGDNGILKVMEQQIGLRLIKARDMLQYLTIDYADRLPHEI